MSGDMLPKIAEEMSALFRERLRLRGKTLEQQLHQAGRQLPKPIRRDAKTVVDALAVQGNPKLARMVDEKRIARAGENVIAHLQMIDPYDRLKARVLNWLGAISAFGIILFVVLLYVAVQRGLV